MGWAGQLAGAERSAAAEGSVSLVGCAHAADPSRVVAVAGTDRGRPRMSLDVDVVIVAMMALTVPFLVAGAEAMWRRRSRRAMADAPRPTSGSDPVTAVVPHARRHPIGRQWSGAQGLAHVRRHPRWGACLNIACGKIDDIRPRKRSQPDSWGRSLCTAEMWHRWACT